MAARSCSLTACMSHRALLLPIRPATHLTAPFSTTPHRFKNPSRPKKALKYMSKSEQAAEKRRRRNKRTSYIAEDLRNQVTYSLCDAIRIIRAAEAGHPPSSPKYDLAIKLRTPKDGPVLRNRLALPHPVRTDLRVCVVCPEKQAGKFKRDGAVLAGLESVIEQVKDGKIEFDTCIAHASVLGELQKSGVAKILGPKRLMPSVKDKTVVTDVAGAIREMMRGAEYRERMGVVRMAVGQLGFTPEMVGENIKAFVGTVKKDIALISGKANKEIHEIVLSSTHGPGLSLSGEFVSREGVEAEELLENA